jgi:hypothetical protein
MSSTNDINYKSYVNEKDLVIKSFVVPPDPKSYSDILKFSNCVNVLVENIDIQEGKEDAIDATRGGKYLFKNLNIRGDSTVKGSIDGYTFEDCIITQSIEIGNFDNYWTLGRAPTRNGTIKNTFSHNGKPVTIWVFDATMPHIINSNVKVIKIPKFVWLPYFLLRRTYLKIKGVIK